MVSSRTALNEYHGPRNAVIPLAGVLLSACLLREMPDDWPDRLELQKLEAKSYGDAKVADPAIHDLNPLLAQLERP